MNQNKPSFVSTFLSHSKVDKPLVEAVARQLGRRGAVTWFDKNELLELGPLDVTLKQAVQQQATLSIFLSEASVNSAWCTDELRWAIEAQDGSAHLLPIYLGEPLRLVKAHELLRKRFLHADGDRVNQLGYVCTENPTDSDINAIANKIAASAYHRSIKKKWSDVIIYLDQRGNGLRRGIPELPENITRLDAPILVFRPDLGSRSPGATLRGTDWSEVVNTMMQSLSFALGTVRGETRSVRVLGSAQTGLMWAIGKHFDRTTSAALYGYGREEFAITNRNQVRHTSLPDGNFNAAVQIGEQSVKVGSAHETVALGVGSQNKFGPIVQSAVPGIPLFWIESGLIQDSEQAMSLVKDIVAVVERLRREYGTRELVLFWTTANHVALLAAANITSHVIPTVKYMEWDREASEYVHLPMSEV